MDENWNIATNGMMPDWPRILLTTVTFEERGGVTDVRLVQTPCEATAEEIECFVGTMRNMDSGWGSGFAIVDEVLAELQSEGTAA